NHGHEAVFDALWNADEDARVDRAGADDVHANLARLELCRPRSREGAHGGLAGVVEAGSREPLHAGDGAGHDDGAAVGDQRQSFLHGEERAPDVDAERGVEPLLGDGAERDVEVGGAGARVQDVDPRLLRLDDVIEMVEVREIAGVTPDAGHVEADILDRAVERLLVPAGDEDVRPFVHEQLGGGESYSGGGPGDDRGLSFQLVHEISSTVEARQYEGTQLFASISGAMVL